MSESAMTDEEIGRLLREWLSQEGKPEAGPQEVFPGYTCASHDFGHPQTAPAVHTPLSAAAPPPPVQAASPHMQGHLATPTFTKKARRRDSTVEHPWNCGCAFCAISRRVVSDQRLSRQRPKKGPSSTSVHQHLRRCKCASCVTTRNVVPNQPAALNHRQGRTGEVPPSARLNTSSSTGVQTAADGGGGRPLSQMQHLKTGSERNSKLHTVHNPVEQPGASSSVTTKCRICRGEHQTTKCQKRGMYMPGHSKVEELSVRDSNRKPYTEAEKIHTMASPATEDSASAGASIIKTPP